MYHETNDICHICNKNYINKFRDHSRQTGRYRGSYNNKLGNLSIQDFRSSLTTKLPNQDEVDDFNKANSKKNRQ